MKVFVQTYGCSFNQADSEVMAGVLEKDGYTLTEKVDDADVVVVNSCVVKNKTQQELFKFIDGVRAKDKKLVIAGCAPSSIPEKLEGLSLVGVENLHAVSEVVEKTLHNRVLVKTQKERDTRFELPKRRHNPVIEIIPISKGCLGSCTYCLTVNARGKLESYTGRQIKRAAEQAVREGVKEIWLTSQDAACWGLDRKQRLPQLIESLTHISGDFRIRVGMGNPNWLKLILDEFLEVLKHPKVFKFVHLPVQSGDDAVLDAMQRGYTVQDYVDMVNKLREAVPEVTISTDVIVGFPGETREQFERTYELIARTKPEVINISKYANRPHTPAARRQPVDGKQVKECTKRLASLHEKIRKESLRRWMGCTCLITIVERGKFPGQWMGRNDSYVPVIVEGDCRLGQRVTVRITGAAQHHIVGTII